MSDEILKFETNPDLYIKIAEGKEDEGDDVGAVTALRSGLRRYPNDLDLLFELAELLCDLEVPEKALDVWYAFLALCPKEDYGDAYNGLGRCYYALHQDIAAEYCFGRQILYAKDFSRLCDDEAFLYYYGNRQGSNDQYYIAYPQPEWKGRYLVAEAENAMNEGKYEEAENLLSKIPYEEEDYPLALALRAACAASEGDEERAEQLMQSLADDDPDEPRSWFALACALAAKGDFAKADESFDRLISLRPYDPAFLVPAALVACNAGKAEKGRAYLEDAIAIDPEDTVAAYYLETVVSVLETPEAEREPIEYDGDVPEDEVKLRWIEIARWLALKKTARNKSLRDDRTKNLIRWSLGRGNESFLGILLAALAETGSEGIAFLKELLLRSSVSVGVKCEILRCILADGKAHAPIPVVFAFVLRRVKFLPFEIDEKDSTAIRCAYARCYAILSARRDDEEEDFGETLRRSAYGLYHRLKERGAIRVFAFERPLAAVIHLRCAFPGESRSIAKTAKLYGTDRREVKDILDFLKGETEDTQR